MIRWLDRCFAFIALAMAILSFVMRDADKAPLYLLVAYLLARLSQRPRID